MDASRAERLIHEILVDYGVNFKMEYIFPDLKSENGKPLRFDFVIFDDDGNINWEWNEDTKEYEPIGEWDRYFSDTSSDANIRPYIFIPETQTEVKHYLCYQVGFRDTVRYQPGLKETQVTFTVFVHGSDRMDKWTGIPRHDLIASIIRERFNWSNIFGMQTHLISSKESTTDNNYLVRTLVFQVVDTNGIVKTTNGITSVNNYQLRR